MSLAIKTGAPSFACGAYVTRPETCRRLDRGSPECLAEYERKRARARGAVRKLSLLLPVVPRNVVPPEAVPPSAAEKVRGHPRCRTD